MRSLLGPFLLALCLLAPLAASTHTTEEQVACLAAGGRLSECHVMRPPGLCGAIGDPNAGVTAFLLGCAGKAPNAALYAVYRILGMLP